MSSRLNSSKSRAARTLRASRWHTARTAGNGRPCAGDRNPSAANAPSSGFSANTAADVILRCGICRQGSKTRRTVTPWQRAQSDPLCEEYYTRRFPPAGKIPVGARKDSGPQTDLLANDKRQTRILIFPHVRELFQSHIDASAAISGRPSFGFHFTKQSTMQKPHPTCGGDAFASKTQKGHHVNSNHTQQRNHPAELSETDRRSGSREYSAAGIADGRSSRKNF